MSGRAHIAAMRARPTHTGPRRVVASNAARSMNVTVLSWLTNHTDPSVDMYQWTLPMPHSAVSQRRSPLPQADPTALGERLQEQVSQCDVRGAEHSRRRGRC